MNKKTTNRREGFNEGYGKRKLGRAGSASVSGELHIPRGVWRRREKRVLKRTVSSPVSVMACGTRGRREGRGKWIRTKPGLLENDWDDPSGWNFGESKSDVSSQDQCCKIN